MLFNRVCLAGYGDAGNTLMAVLQREMGSYTEAIQLRVQWHKEGY